MSNSRHAYDELNRLVNLSHHDSSDQVSADYQCDYDSLSRITQLIDIDGTNDFTYDALSRLLTADQSDLSRDDESYSLDAAGNRTSSHLRGGDDATETDNRVSSNGTFDCGYDSEGNLILRTDTTTGQLREFHHDHRVRLIRITDHVSFGGEITAESTYRYNMFNQRIAKSVDSDGSGAGESSTEHYVYNGDQVVFESPLIPAAVPCLSLETCTAPTLSFCWRLSKPTSNSARDICRPSGIDP